MEGPPNVNDENLVGPVRIELTTNRLKAGCSATELQARFSPRIGHPVTTSEASSKRCDFCSLLATYGGEVPPCA